MSLEIINKIKSCSFIRAVDPGSYVIALSELRANANIETILAAAINDLAWSTPGYITVARNGVTVLNLTGSGAWTNENVVLRNAGANNKSSNIQITIVTGGTILLSVSKEATLNVDTERGLK